MNHETTKKVKNKCEKEKKEEEETHIADQQCSVSNEEKNPISVKKNK